MCSMSGDTACRRGRRPLSDGVQCVEEWLAEYSDRHQVTNSRDVQCRPIRRSLQHYPSLQQHHGHLRMCLPQNVTQFSVTNHGHYHITCYIIIYYGHGRRQDSYVGPPCRHKAIIDCCVFENENN